MTDDNNIIVFKTVKTRLLDSRMLSYFGENWTEWNIKPAMRAWRQDPLRNFGIRIEVEDEEGNQLPTQRFFKPMKCSDDAQTSNHLFNKKYHTNCRRKISVLSLVRGRQRGLVIRTRHLGRFAASVT